MLKLLRKSFLAIALIMPSVASAGDLTVSAAISLKPALEEIGKLCERNSQTKITFNFGASGALEQQIENGAPVDVFLSAAKKQIDMLSAKKLVLPGSVKMLLSNSLVLVVPIGRTNVHSFGDLAKPEIKKIAVGEPKVVPAGDYAQEVFATLKLTHALATKLVPGSNARQVLTYAETGDVDAAVVYATDALDSPKVTIVASADSTWHSPIEYPVAVIKATKHEAIAKAFAAFLSEKCSVDVFRKFGFKSGASSI